MKITNTPNVNRAQKTGRAVATPGSTGITRAQTIRRIADTVQVMGIPAEEMTPKVEAAIMTLMGEVDRLRTELEVAHGRINELEKLVDLDPLIPVANRRAFVRELSRMISYADRFGTKSSLIFIDVNNMKELNDTKGHAAGDKALLHLGDVLLTNVRDVDVVGRLGGDEFGVLLAQTDETRAHQKAVELSERIEKNPFNWQGDLVDVKVAHGAYTFGPGQDPSEALAEADQKMYINKKSTKEGEPR